MPRSLTLWWTLLSVLPWSSGGRGGAADVAAGVWEGAAVPGARPPGQHARQCHGRRGPGQHGTLPAADAAPLHRVPHHLRRPAPRAPRPVPPPGQRLLPAPLSTWLPQPPPARAAHRRPVSRHAPPRPPLPAASPDHRGGRRGSEHGAQGAVREPDGAGSGQGRPRVPRAAHGVLRARRPPGHHAPADRGGGHRACGGGDRPGPRRPQPLHLPHPQWPQQRARRGARQQTGK